MSQAGSSVTAAGILAALRADGPPTINVSVAATALGVARSTLYEAIKRGDAPVRWIQVGTRIKVITASVLDLVGGDPAPVRSGETPGDTRRSEGTPRAVTTSGVKCPGAESDGAGAA